MEEKNLIPDYEANFAVLVAYIDQYQKAGYNVYSDISEIGKLIDFITNWYEIKYPDNIIEMSKESYIDIRKSVLYMIMPRNKSRKTENLSKYMDYYQLMLRLPESMHSILECWYKGKDCTVKGKFATYIGVKESLVEDLTEIPVSQYDGYLDLDSSQFLKFYTRISCNTIEQIIDETNFCRTSDYTYWEFSDPIKVVKTHNLDLEIRNKIFNIIILKLFQTSTSKINGYIRAKLFIDEFNKYIHNLNLSSNILDNNLKELINESVDELTAQNVNDKYIIENIELEDLFISVTKDIAINNYSNNSIDKHGLTFHTLMILKNKNIHNINNLVPGNTITSMDIDIDEKYYSINERDKLMLRKMREEVEASIANTVTTKNLEQKQDDKLEEPKQKRKSIFGRNKQNR